MASSSGIRDPLGSIDLGTAQALRGESGALVESIGSRAAESATGERLEDLHLVAGHQGFLESRNADSIDEDADVRANPVLLVDRAEADAGNGLSTED